ncbi:PhzF family phenazine biosynthesis protein [Primorskyibacter sp. S87]|uniref:PhzF family phenazine biosynthesis protein n=1 Tax=Primorskyibacter sp. S87 TaxID=3415126 RepID=UPI003C7E7FAA
MSRIDSSNLRRIAAFSEGQQGGNPAGVLITETQPSEEVMQEIAAEIGYSETAFATQEGNRWRVRYFAPESEVDFCGHATVALGAALIDLHGPGNFDLRINAGDISVSGTLNRDGQKEIQLVSPRTRTKPIDFAALNSALELFGLDTDDLDPDLLPVVANAGNDHLVLPLRSQDTLSKMHYDLAQGRELMEKQDLTTINLIFFESPRVIHSRNAFAIGGVAEDPATGAAAAALAGYLREVEWPHEGQVEIIQGRDMGSPSRLSVGIPPENGSPVTVSGTVRDIELPTSG